MQKERDFKKCITGSELLKGEEKFNLSPFQVYIELCSCIEKTEVSYFL